MARKIVFAGTPEIAVPALTALAKDEKLEIIGVMCPPDKKVGRKQILTPCAVKIAAQKLHLPIFEGEKKADVLALYKKLKPELIVVIALGIIFPEEALNIAPTINVHFSLLPRWRGASPVQSAILADDKVSGITLQTMVKELDAGDILWQHTEEIKNRGTRELWETWAQESAKALPELVQNFEILPHLPQDETKGTLCSKFQKSDGEIFLERETAEEIMRKYRAFDVWPGIFITTRYGTVGIKECSLEKKSDSVELPCKKGSVWIQTIQLSGKSEASACDIVRGRPDIFRR